MLREESPEKFLNEQVVEDDGFDAEGLPIRKSSNIYENRKSITTSILVLLVIFSLLVLYSKNNKPGWIKPDPGEQKMEKMR